MDLSLASCVQLLLVPLALASHYLFNRHEPSTKCFVLIAFVVGYLGPLIYCLAWQWNRFVSFATATSSFAVYLTTLGASTIAYRLSPWHPLACFPGPVLASTTKWWAVHLILFRGGRHKVLQDLHSKYGPWVRSGPNELSINLPTAVHPIYLHLPRAEFYRGIPSSADTLITIIDRKEHALRRRAWTKALSRAAMPEFAQMANARISQLVSILREDVHSKGIDLHHWTSLLLMDMIGDMAFSGAFETMKVGKDTEGWMYMLNIGAAVVAVLGQVPWLRDVAELFPQKGPIETFRSALIICQFARQKIRESCIRQAVQGVKNDILSTILNDQHHGGYVLSTDEAAADASLLIASSLETTSQAITTIFRHLATENTVLHRLQREVDAVVGNDLEELEYSTWEKLPYLDACVHESLRIIPPAPAGPPRTTGAKGAVILDRYVPPNTTVYVPTWALHRDPDNFRDPETFIPERWLEGSAILPHNPQAYVPFSAGFGACVGKQLALQNIKLIVAHIVRNFTVKLTNDFSVDGFDASYKERGLWVHDPLLAVLEPRVVETSDTLCSL